MFQTVLFKKIPPKSSVEKKASPGVTHLSSNAQVVEIYSNQTEANGANC